MSNTNQGTLTDTILLFFLIIFFLFCQPIFKWQRALTWISFEILREMLALKDITQTLDDYLSFTHQGIYKNACIIHEMLNKYYDVHSTLWKARTSNIFFVRGRRLHSTFYTLRDWSAMTSFFKNKDTDNLLMRVLIHFISIYFNDNL